MIAANVAAARALEAKKSPVMYRVHEPPSREKLVALKDYLATFGIEFALGQVIRPGTFNRVIERVGDGDGREEIMEQLLRTQMQARYAPSGSAISGWRSRPMPTSPRRSAVTPTSSSTARWSAPISSATAGSRPARRSASSDRRADLDARAAGDGGRTRDGRPLCRRLSSPTAKGSWSNAASPASSRSVSSPRSRTWAATGCCSPATSAPNISAIDEAARTLVGDETGETYRIGQKLTLRLAEANPVSGSLRFELPEGSYGGRAAPMRRDRVRRGRPPNIRHSNRRR